MVGWVGWVWSVYGHGNMSLWIAGKLGHGHAGNEGMGMGSGCMLGRKGFCLACHVLVSWAAFVYHLVAFCSSPSGSVVCYIGDVGASLMVTA